MKKLRHCHPMYTQQRSLSCLEQLNTFQFSVNGVEGQIKSTEMCRKTITKVWSGSSEGWLSMM